MFVFNPSSAVRAWLTFFHFVCPCDRYTLHSPAKTDHLYTLSFTYARFASKKTKTYNSRDSLVVTHPTTNRPACGLSTAERTGSPVFHTLWSYVLISVMKLLKISRPVADEIKILPHSPSNFSS